MNYFNIPKTEIIAKLFQYRSAIPSDFSISVYNILTNQSSTKDWNKLDKYVDQGSDVMDWIKAILIDNDLNKAEVKKRMKWFDKQLFGTRH